MFVMTLRKGGLKKVAVVCACGVVLAASAFGIGTLRHTEPVQETAASAAPVLLKTQITSATEMITFLQGYGIAADAAGATVATVTIPRKWDDSFKAFHEVVAQSGLSLQKCKGKKADKWMAVVPALCTDVEKTYAVTLVYKEEAVAAYLLKKPSGEVLPIVQKTAVAAPLTEEEIAANAIFGAEGAASAPTAASTPTVPAAETTASAPAVPTAETAALAPAVPTAELPAPPTEAVMPTE
ncbi:MAG: DUF4830 domain-containing protein [Ruthenibacterium sp.]